MEQDLLSKYSSTVFLCDTTPDGKYVRCDFPCCSQHKRYNDIKQIPVSSWLLNTVNNVRYLEKHVSDEIERFMQMHVENSKGFTQYDVNIELLRSNKLTQLKKLLVIFNLRDKSSNLSTWLQSFIQVVQLKNVNRNDVDIIALSFGSRKELLKNVAKLESIAQKNKEVEIMVVLSCHSSCQGQVFSCTPQSISKLHEFEEFCSLHDFVQCCQNVVKDQLKVIHVSSCFTLKLDESHKDWPVDYTWYESNLKCILSGSAKEVYETGSQSADVFLILRSLFHNEALKVASKEHSWKHQ